MDAFLNILRSALLEKFPGAETRLEPVKGNGRVWGFLIWDQFDGLDAMDRQDEVWNFLRKRFPPEDQHRVASILTMTKDEFRDD